ncbi:MAG: hypothetical protein Q4Q23_02060 [Methanobacteriaceae archaeon]|nr:hypothetical protein [Methanobacteriaceae archaeon]
MTQIKMDNYKGKPGEIIKIQISLSDDNKKVIDNGKIMVTLDTKGIGVCKVNNSKAEMTYKIPDITGQHVLLAWYSGDIKVATASILTIESEDQKDNLIKSHVKMDDYYAKRGDIITISAELVTENNIQVDGTAIFKLNGSTEGSFDVKNNKTQFDFKIPNMVMEIPFFLFVKFNIPIECTNYAVASVLILEPKLDIISVTYPEKEIITPKIRKILNN